MIFHRTESTTADTFLIHQDISSGIGGCNLQESLVWAQHRPRGPVQLSDFPSLAWWEPARELKAYEEAQAAKAAAIQQREEVNLSRFLPGKSVAGSC